MPDKKKKKPLTADQRRKRAKARQLKRESEPGYADAVDTHTKTRWNRVSKQKHALRRHLELKSEARHKKASEGAKRGAKREAAQRKKLRGREFKLGDLF